MQAKVKMTMGLDLETAKNIKRLAIELNLRGPSQVVEMLLMEYGKTKEVGSRLRPVPVVKQYTAQQRQLLSQCREDRLTWDELHPDFRAEMVRSGLGEADL